MLETHDSMLTSPVMTAEWGGSDAAAVNRQCTSVVSRIPQAPEAAGNLHAELAQLGMSMQIQSLTGS